MIVLHDELQWGMHRLAASPVTDATFAAVKAQVARQPGTSLLILARPERDRGYDVLTLLAAQHSLPREFAGALAEAVRGEMGKDIRVAVFSMLSAWAEQADKPVEVPLIIESPSDADSAH